MELEPPVVLCFNKEEPIQQDLVVEDVGINKTHWDTLYSDVPQRVSRQNLKPTDMSAEPNFIEHFV